MDLISVDVAKDDHVETHQQELVSIGGETSTQKIPAQKQDPTKPGFFDLVSYLQISSS